MSVAALSDKIIYYYHYYIANVMLVENVPDLEIIFFIV